MLAIKKCMSQALDLVFLVPTPLVILSFKSVTLLESKWQEISFKVFFLGESEAKDFFFWLKDKYLMLLSLMKSAHRMYFGREYAEFHHIIIMIVIYFLSSRISYLEQMWPCLFVMTQAQTYWVLEEKVSLSTSDIYHDLRGCINYYFFLSL